MPELVTFGETMAALAPDRTGPLRHSRSLSLSVAGAESTVAIGVARLGHSVAWVGRVGVDELGLLVRDTLRSQGVDVRAVIDPAAPTGLMLKERRTADVRRVHYYRAGSAGSRLVPDDLPKDLVESARIVHTGAITAALSATAAATVSAAIARANFASFDANFRSKLWPAAEYRDFVLARLPEVDLLFASLDEARILLGRTEGEPDDLATALKDAGPDEVVVTLGQDGAVCADRDGKVHRVQARPVTLVDPVGAGDSFAAGYLAALLDGGDVPARLSAASRVAAYSVSAEGDWEGLPTCAELTAAAATDIER
jgi:2-dehydro-3-deoxygluconokinase